MIFNTILTFLNLVKKIEVLKLHFIDQKETEIGLLVF